MPGEGGGAQAVECRAGRRGGAGAPGAASVPTWLYCPGLPPTGMFISDKLPVRLSERAVETNVLLRLAYCLEECCGMGRDDIAFHMPTQREEHLLAYDTMVVDVWVALQFKRALRMKGDEARFSIGVDQNNLLRQLFPPGGAFYALTPIADLDTFVRSLPGILDKSYLVDALHMPRLAQGRRSFSLWMTGGGAARAEGRRIATQDPPLKISSLCCPSGNVQRRVGFLVDAEGRMLSRDAGQEFRRENSMDAGVDAPGPRMRSADHAAGPLSDTAFLRLVKALPLDKAAR